MNRTHRSASDAPQRISKDQQFRQRRGNHVRQQRFRAFAFHVRTVQQLLAFIRGQTLGLIDSDAAAARPAFSRFARLAFRVKRTLGNRRATFSTSPDPAGDAARFATFSARRRRLRQTTQFYRVPGPALSSSAVTFAAKRFSRAAQGFWWQLFGADFHRKSFLRHGRLLFVPVAHREAKGFTGRIVSFYATALVRVRKYAECSADVQSRRWLCGRPAG